MAKPQQPFGTKLTTQIAAAQVENRAKLTLTALGLVSLVTGCKIAVSLSHDANAQTAPSSTPTKTPTATVWPSPVPTTSPTSTPTATVTPSPRPWPTPTPWPSPTPWPTPAAWAPAAQVLPTLAAVPVVPANRVLSAAGLQPVSYAPPDGVDVFGNTILRWEYIGELAPDEFFDIKIKPLGSNDSVFVDWSKSDMYELRPWSGWTPGIYTWQIGIIQGYLEGETKHFIADTGRDSEPFIIKWQAIGHGGGGGGGGGGGAGGGSSGGS